LSRQGHDQASAHAASRAGTTGTPSLRLRSQFPDADPRLAADHVNAPSAVGSSAARWQRVLQERIGRRAGFSRAALPGL
ncbi:hypothetical protein ACRAWD_21295, partial [Caulobacter segnis]